MLDLIITGDQSKLLTSVSVVPMDPDLTDHCLLVAVLTTEPPQPVVRSFQYRNIKSIDQDMFAARLRTKSVSTDPANTVDEFADQLDSAIIEVLNETAPQKTCRKRCGKITNK